MKLQFALLSEGSSEHPLVRHLEELCVRFGAEEAFGTAPDLGLFDLPPRSESAERLEQVVARMPGLDLLFVHRDADRAGSVARREEIEKAAAQVELPIVPLIPVTMLEAWLLLDADAIRAAVGQPPGRGKLQLPKRSTVESIADPKALLKTLLAEVSGATGRRLKKINKSFPRNRAFLIDRLDLDGPINDLSA